MNQKINLHAVIIDDDQISCEQLKDLILESNLPVEIMGIYNDAQAGINAIAELDPEILFLDVEMPEMNGFELLKRIAPRKPEVIFVTSYDKYAVKAIRFAALDYILKPVEKSELYTAVTNALNKLNSKQSYDTESSFEKLIGNDSGQHLSTIAIPVLDGLLIVNTSEIVSCESEGSYTHVNIIEGKSIMVSRSLAEFEELLDGSNFIRIHKSTLINLQHLKKYVRGEGGQVILTSGVTKNVGRVYKTDLLSRISNFE
jgi:two-component system, LytTR family, response regulator